MKNTSKQFYIFHEQSCFLRKIVNGVQFHISRNEGNWRKSYIQHSLYKLMVIGFKLISYEEAQKHFPFAPR